MVLLFKQLYQEHGQVLRVVDFEHIRVDWAVLRQQEGGYSLNVVLQKQFNTVPCHILKAYLNSELLLQKLLPEYVLQLPNGVFVCGVDEVPDIQGVYGAGGEVCVPRAV